MKFRKNRNTGEVIAELDEPYGSTFYLGDEKYNVTEAESGLVLAIPKKLVKHILVVLHEDLKERRKKSKSKAKGQITVNQLLREM